MKTLQRLTAFSIVYVLFTFILGAHGVWAQQYTAQKINSVAEKSAQGVVMIQAYREVPEYSIQFFTWNGEELFVERIATGATKKQVSSGTGFFVSKDGYMMTNKHVVSDPYAEYTITEDGIKEYAVKVVYVDDVHDLAVVKVDGEFESLDISTEKVKVGDTVVTVGNAMGSEIDSISTGMVVSVDEDIVASGKYDEEYEELEDLIESTTRLYPGDSGGPLLNEKGEVIGVNVAITIGKKRTSYSIPADVVREVLKKARVI